VCSKIAFLAVLSAKGGAEIFQQHCRVNHMHKTVCTTLTTWLSLVTAHLWHSSFCIFHHNLDLTPLHLHTAYPLLLVEPHCCYVLLKQSSLIAVMLHSCLTGDEDQLVSLQCTHNLQCKYIIEPTEGCW